MSNTGINQGFAKCFIVFMAIVILIEGIVYLGLSIWGLTIANCNEEIVNISENPFKFVMDLIYFAREECNSANISIEGAVVHITMDWEKSFIITNRMFIFMIVYVVVSGLWIITSLMVLFTICCRLTNCILAVCFWPWFLIVIGGSILDAVATGYHVHDILHTTTANETFEYIGASINDNVLSLENITTSISSETIWTYFKQFDPYFVTPAVVLTCVSSRVVLIWLLNIFGTSFCLSLSRNLAKTNSANARSDRVSNVIAVQAAQAPLTVEYIPQQQLQQQPQLQQGVPYPQQIRPKPLPIQTIEPLNLQRTNEPFHSPVPVAETVEYPTLPPSPDNNARQNNLNRQSSSGGNDVTTYRNTDTHPDRLDYPAHQQASSTTSSPIAPPQSTGINAIAEELSTESPLNNRYTPTENPFQHQSANQPQRVSAELRSQLPWSYTSMATKPPPVPRKPQPQTQPQPQQPQLKIYPEIPEPDYVDQPNNGNRPQSSANAQQSYSQW